MAKRLLLILIIFPALGEVHQKYSEKIPASEFISTWSVSLQQGDPLEHFCSGAIIAPTFILTNGYCIEAATELIYVIDTRKYRTSSTAYKRLTKSLRVISGTNISDKGGLVSRVKTTHLHPNYITRGQRTDLGIIELRKPLIYDHRTTAIPLYESNDLEDFSADVLSWEQPVVNVSSYETVYCNLSIPRYEVCAKRLKNHYYQFNRKNMCGFSPTVKNECNNSLRYAIFKYEHPKMELIGLDSTVVPCAKYRPFVATRLYPHLRWIRKTAKLK